MQHYSPRTFFRKLVDHFWPNNLHFRCQNEKLVTTELEGGNIKVLTPQKKKLSISRLNVLQMLYKFIQILHRNVFLILILGLFDEYLKEKLNDKKDVAANLLQVTGWYTTFIKIKDLCSLSLKLLSSVIS